MNAYTQHSLYKINVHESCTCARITYIKLTMFSVLFYNSRLWRIQWILCDFGSHN